MEQSQIETLNRSDSVFPFPPHRRRLLKSETFCTLVRILSHCYGDSQPSHSNRVFSDEPKPDSGEKESGQATEPELRGEPVGQTGVESETLLVQGDTQSLKGAGIDECLDEDIMDMGEDDHVNRINKVNFREDGVECGNSLEDKNPSSNLGSLVADQEGQCSLLEICMEELRNERQVVVDNEQLNFEVAEDFDMAFDMDILDEFPNFDDSNAEGSSLVERHVLEDVGHGIELMELEKSSYGVMNSPLCITADEEIEEGEISGNDELYDQSTDLLLEDSVSLDKEKIDEGQTSEAVINKEQFKERKGANQEDNNFNKNFGERIDNVCDSVELAVRVHNTSVEHNLEMIVCGKSEGAKMAHGYNYVLDSGQEKKQATSVNEEFNHPVAAEIFGENATENQGTSSNNKDAGVSKKQKRGPVTKERRAKKKQKERIKRAEKNRQLGVKRLKIQPVVKPKKVTDCRHYLMGRCQQGEKCKFSHDAIPLTKSKPCSHFARHSCMKGDDCPYDHQLSKYPCNKYTSKGYCSRGTDCMFSHEMPPKEGSPSTMNVPKPQSESSSRLRGASSPKQLNLPPCKNTEQNVLATTLKPAVQTPKGISKVMFGKSSLGNPSNLNQAASFAKADIGVKSGLPIVHNTPDMTQNSNENRSLALAQESKGINFLSFGKAPIGDSSSKKPSGLSSSRDFGFQESPFGDFSKDKLAALSSKKDDGFKIGNQTGQSVSDTVHNLSEMQKRTPAVVPRGINFLSFGKAPLDDSSNIKAASSPSNVVKDDVSSAQERKSAAKLEIPNAKPWKLLPSSVPSDQSLEHGKDKPSSALKALLSNTPNSTQKGYLSNKSNSAQKSLQSMLAFAAKYESKIKMDHPAVSSDSNMATSSSQNTSRGSTIMDFLNSEDSKTKQ